MMTKEKALELYHQQIFVWTEQCDNLFALSSSLGLAGEASDDGNRFTEACRGLHKILDKITANYNNTLFHFRQLVEILEAEAKEEASTGEEVSANE